MLEIQEILKDKYNIATGIQQNIIFGDNGLIKVQIELPRANCSHADVHSKWLLRMAPSESFDRWSVSAAVCERFDGAEQIVNYLSDPSEIYKRLFKRLSKDYQELYSQWEELEFENFEKRPI